MLRLIALLVVAEFAITASAQEFSDAHFYLDYGGPSGDPFAITKLGSQLYVGGGFLDVDGKTDLKNLARFNLRTEAWEQVPGIDSNHNNFVRALHRANDGTLLIGGDFTSIGGAVVQKIARFDQATNTWSSLFDPTAGDNASGPLGGGVYSITSFGDHIYIGGFIFNHDNPAWRYVRSYNTATSRWSNVGEGLNDRVSSLVADGSGMIYAGGGFTMSREAEVKGVARWNGSVWEEVGGGVVGDVRAIALAPDGTLYVGGQFTSAGGQPASNVASWNGATWNMLDGGIEGGGAVNGVYGMSIDASGRVYISGDFDTAANGTVLNKVALWDGSGKWQALGSGLGKSSSQIVNSVYAFGNDAYFGGVFADPNGSPNAKKNFARWNSGMDFTDYIPGLAGLESSFTIENVNGEAVVGFNSISGVSYVLQSSDSNLGNWQTISNPIIGNGNRWIFTLPIISDSEYYRILVSLN